METLKTILKDFDVNRSKELNKSGEDHFPNNDTSNSLIASCFQPIADEILFHGHFLVKCIIDGKVCEYGIRVDALELYYSEEVYGGYVDKIMYHITDRVPYYLRESGLEKYPYYEFGSFNLHQSGVDVTFENPDKKYRASFLIRKISIVGADGVIIRNSEKTDEYSTHIFDYLFPNGYLCKTDSSIHWITEEGIAQHAVLDFRQNLPDDISRNKMWQFRRPEV